MNNHKASILTTIEATKKLDKGGLYLIAVNLPFGKFNNINYFEVNDNIGKAYLSDSTTEKDALDGFTRFGLTGTGRNCVIVNLTHFKEWRILEIENYLNNRFGDFWSVSLEELSTGST